MKVKVNGAWVDVPAFKVTEKVGDVAVIEGDITLTSASNSFSITHNLDVVPIFVDAYLTTPQTNVNFMREIVGWVGDVRNYVVTIRDSGESPYKSGITFSENVFSVSGLGYRMDSGIYHYKIYYAI